ncbi:hypothetical protein EGJ58_10545 [Brucella anthropi]|nr:hypothetical protein EGJ58_10545 [Brucella anthropi]
MLLFSPAPHIAASKVVNDLDDAGYRIVEHHEIDGIIRRLIELVEEDDKLILGGTHPAVIKAKAILEILNT